MTRVLVVDDSAVYRKLIARMLEGEPGVEVVGYAADPYEARERIAELRPDVVTLDVEMPRMDGLAFLEKLMRSYPLPVVLLSTLGVAGSDVAVRALALGAVEVVAKPSADGATGETAGALRAAVRAAGSARVGGQRSPGAPIGVAGAPPRAPLAPPSPGSAPSLIVIGASTGGTRAIEAISSRLPATLAPVLAVIHMPAGFTEAFARRLSSVTEFDVREAVDGDALETGAMLVAPAGRHLRVVARGGGWGVRVYDGPPVKHHRPNIDVVLHSVAEQVGAAGLGVLLTGMGADGARGLLELRARGGFTLAEAEESCVVYGMPRVAAELGAATRVVPLESMAGVIADRFRFAGAQRALGTLANARSASVFPRR